MAVVALTPVVSVAKLTDADRQRLVAEITAAAQQLDASRLPQLDSSKQQVLQRIESLDQFLAARTSAENRQAWLEYLDVQPLKEAIEADQSVATMGREAVALRFRLIGTSPGLELRHWAELRDSVQQLIHAITFRDPERSLTTIAKQLEALSDRVNRLGDVPSSEDIAVITAIMGLVDASGQADDAIAAMRHTFSRPNVAVLIGESLVQEVVRQDVNQSRPVRDCILGTRIIGTATMNGVVTADLLPAVGSARMQVSLAGNIVSNNTGYNGPVRLKTVGYGDVNVSRTVHLDESGVRMDPAEVRAALRTEIRAICHKLRLVRNIAKKKAAQQKPQADRIAAFKMRNQVSRQFTSQTDQAGGFTPPDAFSDVRPMLSRLSLSEPTRFWGSTDDSIFIDSTFRGSNQLSTVVSRPPLTTAYDAAIQIHESVINNAFSPVLAGRTLKESQLNRLLEEAGQELPNLPADDKEDAKSEPPFEIDFARLQPIVFQARDQTIRIGVRGTRFVQGRRELKRAMEITAIYHPVETEDGRIILKRDGEVDVSFPGGKRLTVTQAGLKPTIQTKFGRVFPDVLLDRPLEVPEDTKIDPLKGRVFHPRLVEAQDGWLTIAVR